MMIEQKEAVIFDLDGTMTDSMWIWEEIDQDILFESISFPRMWKK